MNCSTIKILNLQHLSDTSGTAVNRLSSLVLLESNSEPVQTSANYHKLLHEPQAKLSLIPLTRTKKPPRRAIQRATNNKPCRIPNHTKPDSVTRCILHLGVACNGSKSHYTPFDTAFRRTGLVYLVIVSQEKPHHLDTDEITILFILIHYLQWSNFPARIQTEASFRSLHISPAVFLHPQNNSKGQRKRYAWRGRMELIKNNII